MPHTLAQRDSCARQQSAGTRLSLHHRNAPEPCPGRRPPRPRAGGDDGGRARLEPRLRHPCPARRRPELPQAGRHDRSQRRSMAQPATGLVAGRRSIPPFGLSDRECGRGLLRAGQLSFRRRHRRRAGSAAAAADAAGGRRRRRRGRRRRSFCATSIRWRCAWPGSTWRRRGWPPA